jgi:hypothetical protein
MCLGRPRTLLALSVVAIVAAYICRGLLADPTSYGAHDWDIMEAHRYLAVVSLTRFHQFPFWDPFACGGFPSWASPEGGTTLLSPLLPVYLYTSLATAIRVEVVFGLVLALTGTWLLAGRFCGDPILRAGVCIIAVMNSRWAMQAAAGHTWHLYYAWLSWVLWAAIGLVEEPARRATWLSITAGCLAMMVYTGAIYPFPHAVLAMLGYAAYVAFTGPRRDYRALLDALTATVIAVGLAAPKLFPMLDSMAVFPRNVSSLEYLDVVSYVRSFTSTEADRARWAFGENDYGYHEHGIYIGVIGLAACVYGVWRRPPTPSGRAMRFVGLAFIALSFGAFGPWLLLHQLPVFRSQHVPHRFAYPAITCLAVVAAAAIERAIAARRTALRSPWLLDAAIIVVTLVAGAGIAVESQTLLARGFGVHPPPVIERATYAQTFAVPRDLAYADSNGPSALTVHQANVGSIQCNCFHGFNHDAWKWSGGRPAHLAAVGAGEATYRGEAYLASGIGSARIEEWSPNEVTIDVRGATPGDAVVMNQNWDPGWRANDEPAIAVGGVAAYRVAAGDQRIVFRYRPRALDAGFGALAVALTALGALFARGRQQQQAALVPALQPEVVTAIREEELRM